MSVAQIIFACPCCGEVLPTPPHDVAAALAMMTNRDALEVVKIVAHGGSAWITTDGRLRVSVPMVGD